MTTVLTGSDKCYPYWDESATVDIGTELDGKVIKNDYFVWLTQEGVSCTTSTGVTKLGHDNCKYSKKSGGECSVTKSKRLGVGANSSSICIPTLTWTARS